MHKDINHTDNKPQLSLKLAAFSLGFSSIITQLLVIREFYNFFRGNELIVGILFANWMLIMALGAWAGKFLAFVKKKTALLAAQFLFAFLPVLTILLLRTIRTAYFETGVPAGMNDTVVVSFVVLFAFCFLAGLLFAQLCSVYSAEKGEKAIIQVYFTETLGSIAGGLLFSFLLVFYLKTFDILRLLLLLNLAVLFLLAHSSQKRVLKMAILIMAGLVLASFAYELDIRTKKNFFKGQEIVQDWETPYGNITVTRTAEQINFFESGFLVHSSGDITAAEEQIHYAMSLHPRPINVLLVSGAISGSIEELLKYEGVQIDYVDYNPYAVRLARQFGFIPENGINTVSKDAIIFLKEKEDAFYDVIIIDMPEPVNAQINNYYTAGFFRLIRSKLKDDGIGITSLNGTANYMSEQAAHLHGIIFNTIKTVFENVVIMPAGRNFFLFSHHELGFNFIEGLDDKGIDNVYVNMYYIDEQRLEKESAVIISAIAQHSEINTGLKPLAYFSQISYWLSQSGTNWHFALGIAVILILIMAIRFNPINFCLFTGGFAGTALQLMIIMVFQIVYGYLYGAIGVIISVMMGGIALGALLVKLKKIKPDVISLIRLQLLLVVFAFLMPLCFVVFMKWSVVFWLSHIIFVILTLLLGFFVGAEFAVSSNLLKKNAAATAAELYSADLIGAALGAVLAAAFLVPVFGITYVCFAVALINALSALVLFVKRRNY